MSGRYCLVIPTRDNSSGVQIILNNFSYEIALMVIFCVMTCMTTDWVKSKPLIGFCGVASAMLGTLTAFGFCLYIGIPFAGVNMVASFLMLGKE